MAGTAAAAVGSAFSTSSIQTLKCIHSSSTNNWFSDPFLRVVASKRMISQIGSLSHNHTIDYYYSPINVSVSHHKWRVPRISAALAQEEAPVPTADAETPPEPEPEPETETPTEAEAEAPEAETEAEAVNTKLYFGNLPYLCDSAQLAGIIQDYGSPELVEVLYDRNTGRSRGFAFVTMSSIEDCNAVIKNLDGSEYGGRTLRVNFADKPKPREPLYPETEYKLFVGNLAWSVTSESLTQAFQGYGDVVGARVLYDGETGRSRGYGFVCYSSKPEMDAALQALDGLDLDGRAIRVSLAQGKRQQD